MIDFLANYFIMDRRKTRIYYIIETEQDDGSIVAFDAIVMVDIFIEMFGVAIQKAIDNGTDVMEEIREFDPENKWGYNNLIV